MWTKKLNQRTKELLTQALQQLGIKYKPTQDKLKFKRKHLGKLASTIPEVLNEAMGTPYWQGDIFIDSNGVRLLEGKKVIHDAKNIQQIFEKLDWDSPFLLPHQIPFLQSLESFYKEKEYLTAKQFKYLAYFYLKSRYIELMADDYFDFGNEGRWE